MIEWTEQPSLLPGAIQFGKHRGTPWCQVDPSYLEWVVKPGRVARKHAGLAKSKGRPIRSAGFAKSPGQKDSEPADPAQIGDRAMTMTTILHGAM